MSQFVIQGGIPLSGHITPIGNKNAALPCIAAALLTDEPVELQNVPDILDVRVMLEIVQSLGARVEHLEPGTVRITAGELTTTTLPEALTPAHPSLDPPGGAGAGAGGDGWRRRHRAVT